MTSELSEQPEPDVFRVSHGPRRLLTLAAVLVILISLMAVVPVPYVVMKPGPATDILGSAGQDGARTPVLTVSGEKTFPTEGPLFFTTVLVVGGPGRTVSALDAVLGWASPSQAVLPEEAVYPPGQTQEQAEEEGQAEMASSQETAAVVALRELGQVVPALAEVSSVPQDSPNAGTLLAGDVIVEVDGVPTAGADAVRTEVTRHTAGSSFPMVVQRKGSRTAVSVRTASGSSPARIGVLLQEGYDLPISVTVSSGHVGGPSAGLMFALAIYDVLTPGALTGGTSIAGTGTISPDGQVGPIGGIEQKMVGAREQGAEFFLAPAANCAEVSGAVPDGLTAVRVQTFAEARSAVESIARGETGALPTC